MTFLYLSEELAFAFFNDYIFFESIRKMERALKIQENYEPLKHTWAVCEFILQDDFKILQKAPV